VWRSIRDARFAGALFDPPLSPVQRQYIGHAAAVLAEAQR
jgi:hypothetical protein